MERVQEKVVYLQIAALFVLSVFLAGCSFLGYFDADLSVSVTNDKNHLLAVEGRTSMPDETPVSVVLREGKEVLAKGSASVKSGAFAVTLDLSTAPGNCALNLDIVLDPSKGPESVQRVTGKRGEYLYGEQVEEVGNLYLLTERLRLVLPMDRRAVAIRRAMSGDYNLAITNLEDMLAIEPDDQDLKAWLAYSLLSRDPHEDKLGSQAYQLLGSVKVERLSEPVRTHCKKWVRRLQQLKAEQAKESERKKAIAKTMAKREALKGKLEAGKFLGGVYLGSTAREVYELAIPDKYPAWSDEVIVYHMPDRNVEVHFDGKSSEVIEVHSEDPKFAAKNNVGVGSSLLEAAGAYPDGRLTMGPAEAQPDGTSVAFGEYSCPEGLVFYIKRLTATDGLILSEKVKGLSVVPPFQWDSEEVELDEGTEINANRAGEALVDDNSYPKSNGKQE